MHCIIAGSRSITNYDLVVQAIEESGFLLTEVISGHAKGVDQLGERWAKEHNVRLHIMPAEWAKYGRSAGIRRNGDMARYALERKLLTGEPAGLILVWDGQSKGSASMAASGTYFQLRVYQKLIVPTPDTCLVQPDLF